MTTNTTAPAYPATLSLTVNHADLAALGPLEHLAIHAALNSALYSIHGIMLQPRSEDANAFLEEWVEFIGKSLDMLGRVSRSAVYTDPIDVERKAWLQIQRAADHMDGLPDVAALAAQSVADLSTAQFHARRTAA